MEHHPLVIVGSGPAGWTAAIYAARAMLTPLVFTGEASGGQLLVTTEVENFPGFAEPIMGPWLMEQMEAQALRSGALKRNHRVKHLDLTRRPFLVTPESGDRLSADALILATGAEAQWLGLESETYFRGYGVSACATCDGFFYRGKEVLVVGGGNTAVEEALFLTRFAKRVTIIHRRSSLRAEKVMQKRLFDNPKVVVKWNRVIEQITGETSPRKVTGATLRDVQSGETSQIAADGIFIAIGHKPATELFGESLSLKPSGVVALAPGSSATSCAGVFAAGDVADDRYRQAVTAAGMGCMAALEAVTYLTDL